MSIDAAYNATKQADAFINESRYFRYTITCHVRARALFLLASIREVVSICFHTIGLFAGLAQAYFTWGHNVKILTISFENLVLHLNNLIKSLLGLIVHPKLAFNIKEMALLEMTYLTLQTMKLALEAYIVYKVYKFVSPIVTEIADYIGRFAGWQAKVAAWGVKATAWAIGEAI